MTTIIVRVSGWDIDDDCRGGETSSCKPKDFGLDGIHCDGNCPCWGIDDEHCDGFDPDLPLTHKNARNLAEKYGAELIRIESDFAGVAPVFRGTEKQLESFIPKDWDILEK